MDLLTQIINAESDEKADEIITKNIELINSSKEPINQLGFLDYNKCVPCYQGFIPLNTRIKYASMNIETYGMESTDYFYDFAHFIRKYNINNKGAMIYSLENFINLYFGYPGKTDREEIFNVNAWKKSAQAEDPDEEYFRLLENNKIGDLKGMGAAECTERGALAQQILSLFGTESYYCIGCMETNNMQECHCFNIVKRKNDYALLDYSVPVQVIDESGKIKNYYPFIGELSNEEFMDFANNGIIKCFDDYQCVGNRKQQLNSQRKYVVGSYSIEQKMTL